MSDEHTLVVVAGNKKGKKRKEKFHETFDGGRVPYEPRNIKRVILSLTKPSYTLGLGLKKVRTENRDRLCYLLRKLTRQHNWTEASGVLSMLLKGTCKDSSPTLNRWKYWVTMELLKNIEIDQINPTKIKHIYETWMRRIGSMKQWPTEDRFLVQLDFIFFCLIKGSIWEAHQAALCLMQEREFGNNPISNMVVGLTFYQLWYSTIPQEMQLRDSEEPYSPMQSDKSATRFSYPNEQTVWSDAVSFIGANSPPRCDSYTSVMNNKEILVSGDVKLPIEGSVKANIDLQREMAIQAIHAQGFYMHSTESSEDEAAASFNPSDNLLYSSIFSGQEWDLCLLPLRSLHPTENFEDFVSLHKEAFNDHHKNAVKYLRLALYSTPPVLAALLPLIQLLLLVGQLKEALNELEKFCSNTNMPLLFRLRASILEHLDRNNSAMLSTCFEDILRKDPTCSHSLARLVSMHQNGDYALVSLLEMIALHLDATYADHDMWREFALCSFKLSQYEEDRMSVCLDGNKRRVNQDYSVRLDKIPTVLIEGKSGKAWRFRCRWWLTRHFSKTMLASEIAAGDLQLLTYKAACASHMYGSEFEYVAKAIDHLEKENDRDLLLFLRRYAHNAIGFYKNFERKRML